MRFRLVYDGRIKSNSDNRDKWAIRRAFEPQIRRLWDQEPLSHLARYKDPEQTKEWCLNIDRHGVKYVPLVSTKLKIFAELDVLFLTANKPGDIIHNGGDLDNRMKTLLDGLTTPANNQVPPADFQTTDGYFHCLLEDDKLVTRVAIEADQHLTLERKSLFVLAIINVKIRLSSGTMSNLGLVD